MEWSDVLADPTLQDLPYKIELNAYGQIVMTPASNRHGVLQTQIASLVLGRKPSGVVQVECSVDTPSGVKVADTVWYSDAFVERHGMVTPFPAAPELCVEVASPSNSKKEMEEKKALYFGAGAQEVWVCDAEGAGEIRFFGPDGSLKESRLFPGFPKAVAV